MKKKQALTSEKEIPRPKQQRSQVIYDSIINATYLSIEEKGYRSSTTNFIAELAGVSIGSLYRYFPDKDKLLRTVFDHYMVQNKAFMVAVIENSRGLSAEDAIDHFVHMTTNRFLEKKRFFLIFMTKMFETNNQDLVFQGRRVLAEALTDVTEANFPELNITSRKAEVIDQLHLACHSFMSALLAVLQSEDMSLLELNKKNMSNLFKSILIVQNIEQY